MIKKYIKKSTRFEKKHIDKINNFSLKATKKFKISTQGTNRELASKDAVIRFAIDVLKYEDFEKNIEENKK